MFIRITVDGYNFTRFLAENVAFKRFSNPGLYKVAQTKTLVPKNECILSILNPALHAYLLMESAL